MDCYGVVGGGVGAGPEGVPVGGGVDVAELELGVAGGVVGIPAGVIGDGVEVAGPEGVPVGGVGVSSSAGPKISSASSTGASVAGTMGELGVVVEIGDVIPAGVGLFAGAIGGTAGEVPGMGWVVGLKGEA